MSGIKQKFQIKSYQIYKIGFYFCKFITIPNCIIITVYMDWGSRYKQYRKQP